MEYTVIALAEAIDKMLTKTNYFTLMIAKQSKFFYDLNITVSNVSLEKGSLAYKKSIRYHKFNLCCPYSTS